MAHTGNCLQSLQMDIEFSSRAEKYCTSIQNKILNLADQSTIMPKFIYGKEGKPARLTPVLPVSVRSPALILKTAAPHGY